MNLRILAVGKLKKGPERQLFDRYIDLAQKAGRTLHMSLAKTLELNESRAGDTQERKKQEGLTLLEKADRCTFVISLDEKGKQLSSLEFSQKLINLRDNGTSEIALIIGGPDGLSQEIKDRSSLILSFGRMTMPHGLVRVLVAEQVYRAMSIATGHPYHRE